MSYELSKLLSYSIFFGAGAALFRVWTADRRFFPFIILIITGLIAEVISSYYIQVLKESNAEVYNSYLLVECILLLWQFRNWKTLSTKWFRRLLFILIGCWSMQHFYFSALNVMNSAYIIGHSILFIFLSMETITRMLYYEDYRIWRNPKFIICWGLLLFLMINMIVEVFWMLHVNEVLNFKSYISGIRNYINAFVNLLFAIAILWIPRKPRYTLAW